MSVHCLKKGSALKICTCFATSEYNKHSSECFDLLAQIYHKRLKLVPSPMTTAWLQQSLPKQDRFLHFCWCFVRRRIHWTCPGCVLCTGKLLISIKHCSPCNKIHNTGIQSPTKSLATINNNTQHSQAGITRKQSSTGINILIKLVNIHWFTRRLPGLKFNRSLSFRNVLTFVCTVQTAMKVKRL